MADTQAGGLGGILRRRRAARVHDRLMWPSAVAVLAELFWMLASGCGYPSTPGDLAEVRDSLKLVRENWQSIRTPFADPLFCTQLCFEVTNTHT